MQDSIDKNFNDFQSHFKRRLKISDAGTEPWLPAPQANSM
jgi:hypothetical protein